MGGEAAPSISLPSPNPLNRGEKSNSHSLTPGFSIKIKSEFWILSKTLNSHKNQGHMQPTIQKSIYET